MGVLRLLYLFIITIIVTSFNVVTAQPSNLDSVEAKINDYLNLINYYRFEDTSQSKFDSLEILNVQLRHYMEQVLTDKQTLDYNFKKIDTLAMTIASSGDGKFRIYSWETWLGGSMRDFDAIIQFVGSTGIRIKPLYGSGDILDDISEWYPYIYEVSTNDGAAIYLPQGHSIYSAQDIGISLQAYCINKDSLNPVDLFVTTNDTLNSIKCSYNYFTHYDPGAKNPLIHLSQDKKLLYIPVIDTEKFTGRFLRYYFDGYRFVYKKKRK